MPIGKHRALETSSGGLVSKVKNISHRFVLTSTSAIDETITYTDALKLQELGLLKKNHALWAIDDAEMVGLFVYPAYSD